MSEAVPQILPSTAGKTPSDQGGPPGPCLTGERPVITSGGSSDPRPTGPERIERILLQEGLLSSEQIARARKIQARLEEPKPLAAIALELGWITRARLESALRQYRRALPIEEILVEKGCLTEEELAEARGLALEDKRVSLGRYLVSMGKVGERDFAEAYCEKHDLPFIDADPSLVNPAVLKKVSLKYMAHHRVLPLSVQDGKLNVVVEDLEHPEVLSELGRLFGCPTTASIGEASRITETIAALAECRGGEGATPRPGGMQYHQIAETSDSGKAATEIVDHLLLESIRRGASDIHVEPMKSKLRIRFRIDGRLVHITDYPGSYTASIVSRLKVLAEADIAEHRAHQDGRIRVKHGKSEVDFRVSIYVTVFGENVVLRLLRKERTLVGLEELGFSPAALRTLVDDILAPPSGIVLVTGPTGSGKTTTLYAAIDYLNDDTKKIITCEDPVEYVIEGIVQCSIANRPGLTFLDSLRAIVRQDPDIILVGEVRDRASAEIAIQSALTGHKVLTTFHTEDSVGALVRLIDMEIESFLIASTVTAVVAQRLVRRLCPNCRMEHAPTPTEIRALSLSREEIATYRLTRGKGCPSCLYTGYRGRVGVYEVLPINDWIRDAILRKKSAHELRLLAMESPGFICLQEDGVLKALRGETTLTEVAQTCPRAKTMRPIKHLMEISE